MFAPSRGRGLKHAAFLRSIGGGKSLYWGG
jgi:hypothetical protein